MTDRSLTFWTYILENAAGRFYIGHTDNLERRLLEHNAEEKIGTKHCHKHGLWQLVWSEPHPTRSEAMRRERFIKSRKSATWIRTHLLASRASPDGHRD